jgi:tRNA modification GTPase
MDALVTLLRERAATLLPSEGEVAINRRHRGELTAAVASLTEAEQESDLLIKAEALRRVRAALDRLSGRAGVEDMLDALFSGFCIGK